MDQRLVDDDDAILGVGSDVAEVVWAQTRVERMDHRSHERNREVELEMLGLVPQQRRHPIAILDAQLGEPACEPPGTIGALAKGHATHGSVRTTRHHGGGRIQSLRPLHQHRQRQLKVVHHQTVQHGFLHFLMYVVCINAPRIDQLSARSLRRARRSATAARAARAHAETSVTGSTDSVSRTQRPRRGNFSRRTPLDAGDDSGGQQHPAGELGPVLDHAGDLIRPRVIAGACSRPRPAQPCAAATTSPSG